MKALQHGTFLDAAEDALELETVQLWTGDDTFGSSELPAGWKRSWNAPTCERCWVERRGFQVPVRNAGIEAQRRGARVCAFCGRPTWAGILTRANPVGVPYPTLEELD